MKRTFLMLAAVVLVSSASACAKAKRPALQPSAPVPGAILWVEPTDLATRDLFYGPWGKQNAPDPADTFTLVATKHSGVNLGHDGEGQPGPRVEREDPVPRRPRLRGAGRSRGVAAAVGGGLPATARLFPAGLQAEGRPGHARPWWAAASG